MSNIKIEFFHDTICSFCFPMSFRMRQLFEDMPELEIVHRSFALVKDATDFDRMFGSRENAKKEIMHHWENANRIDDLHRFNIQGMKAQNFLFPTSMNALWASKAAYFVGGESAYWDVFDALQDALFCKNLNIEDEKVIFNVVEKLDLDFDAFKKNYYSQEIKQSVEEDLKRGNDYGIHSIPTLVINGEYVLNGAVSLDQIKETLKQIESKQNSMAPKGNACSIDGCS